MKKILIGGTVIVLLALGGWWWVKGSEGNGAEEYKLAEVTRGDLENVISSTGVLSPVTTVEIGTQVSGIIANVLVDFNDHVKEGQLLAVLDTVLLKTSVLEAQAGLEKSEAQLEQAQSDYSRFQALYDQALISEAEFLPYSVALKTAKAQVKSSQASLNRAENNMKYAVIRSPISGTVIERNVEAGQTVAASLSTPTLFIIAKDLSKMEILADVDESDIGEVKEGQTINFEVPAYPDKSFTGIVSQVRLQPTTVSNVVTYTVVAEADNEDDLLLPGMTAVIDFVIESRDSVLTVPNTALRFQPSDEVLTAFQEKRRQEMENLPDSVKEQMRERRPRPGGPDGQLASASGTPDMSSFGRVWYLDENGEPAIAPVRIGITNGTNTEIVASRVLKENMQVITGNSSGTSTSSTSSERGGFRGGPPHGPGF